MCQGHSNQWRDGERGWLSNKIEIKSYTQTKEKRDHSSLNVSKLSYFHRSVAVDLSVGLNLEGIFIRFNIA